MNDILTITNQVGTCDRKEVVRNIMTICRAITPYFYKNAPLEEVRAEKLSIKLLTSTIDNKTLAKMCELATINYPLERANNYKTYFDINYILKFYKKAFNYVWCDSVNVKDCTYLGYEYDEITSIVTENWRNDITGEYFFIKEIKNLPTQSQDRVYSSKYYESKAVSFDNL